MLSPMHRVLGFAVQRPVVVLLLIALITAFFGTRIVDPATRALQLRIDPSFDAILPDDAPARVFYDWTQEEFGDDKTLILSLVTDDIYTPEQLERVQRITDAIEDAPGVDYVTSLATADHISNEDGSIDTRPFLEPLPETPAEALRIRQEVENNPVYAGHLVSADRRATSFVVHVDDTPEQDFTDAGLDLAMQAIAEAHAGDGKVFISGTAHMRSATSRVLRGDLAFMLPTVAGLMAIIAFFSFRSPRGVAIPMATILLALFWTLGLMAWTDVPINLVTTTVPTLLLTVGFAYSVHVIADYNKALARPAEEVDAAGGPAAWALRHVSLPVLLTCLTTIVGFLSLTISDFPAVREFGLVSVFGVAATTALTLTFAPALLQQLGAPKRAPRAEAPAPSAFDALAARVGAFSVRHRRGFMIGAALLTALTLWGVAQIRVDTHLITNFAPDHPVRVHFDAISRDLEGARPLSVVLKGGEEGAFLQPENLRALDELKVWLEAQPEIGGASAFSDYVMLLNRAFHDDDPAQLGIPDDPNLIQQYLLFGETDDLEDYVASNYQNTLIKVRSNTETTHEIAGLLSRIEERMQKLPIGLEGGTTGNTVVLAQSIDSIARGQVESLSVAAVFIYVMLSVLFASPKMGFYGLVPNILPVLAFFGVLGLTGVPLNATTGLIACVVLGVAVDDTIHFMTRFNLEARERADEKQGALAALASVARPVTITTIGLVLGFLVFTVGDLRNQTEFGALSAVVLAFAWAVDISFTPALCSGLRIVTLWDVLTYDLGKNPQDSIPIFKGLSVPQARITALMTNVVRFPAGQPIFQAGETGDEVFVVIDGELQIALKAEDGRRLELSKAARGDLLGEVGLYHGQRTADVTALSDVRLLRLDAAGLARLRSRYPRIGSQVLWNLSTVMANRLAQSTERETDLQVRLDALTRA